MDTDSTVNPMISGAGVNNVSLFEECLNALADLSTGNEDLIYDGEVFMEEEYTDVLPPFAEIHPNNNGFEFSSIDALSTMETAEGDFVLPDFGDQEEGETVVLGAISPDLDVIDHIVEAEHVPVTIQCKNCDEIFQHDDFAKHICDYDENKDKILENELHPLSDWHDVNNLACYKITCDNISLMQKFLNETPRIYMGKRPRNQPGGQKQMHKCSFNNSCNKSFVHPSGLARHATKHVAEATSAILDVFPTKTLSAVVKCLVCGQVFAKPSYAMKHLEENHKMESGPTAHKVIDQFEEEENLRAMERILGEKVSNASFEVLVNDERAAESPLMDPKQLIAIVIISAVLQCEFCDLLFSDTCCLLAHAVHHHPINGYECQSCEIRCATAKQLILHFKLECAAFNDVSYQKIRLARMFACNVCEEKLESLEQLHAHRYECMHFFPRLDTANNCLLVGCEACGKCFMSVQALMIHRIEAHMKTTKKSNEQASRKPRHLSKSTTTAALNGKFRQYLCDVCGKSYTQSSHLWQHLRFHKGVKPFECNVPGCNRKFTIRPDLNDHTRKCHTGERPYHCLICGKRFLTGSVYYQHRLIHRGERRYGCDDCDKRFYRADALKNHQLIHSGQKPFPCDFCGKSFRQRGDRDKHVKARHTDPVKRRQSTRPRQKSCNSAVKKQQSAPRPAANDDVLYVGMMQIPKSMIQATLPGQH